MSQSGPLPWLEVNGVEIGNAARTLSYLRAGLGNTLQGHWEIGGGDVCSVLYRLAGCAPTVFQSPAADPAPWYDPKEPGAASFLGFVLLDIKGYDSTLTRTVTPRRNALGGGVFTGQNREPRTWKFRAAMVSADDDGAEYGLRWLTQQLQASACATCETGELAVRLVCPPDNCSEDERGKWRSYDVALTEGPKEVEPWGPSRTAATTDNLGGCRDYVIVEWTMVAGNPFLYKSPVECLDVVIAQAVVCNDICDFLFGTSGTSHCCLVSPPARGVLGSIFTVFSRYGFGGLKLEAYVVCPGGSGPDTPPDLQIALSAIPAGSTVVVDSAKHTITVTDANGVVTDGTHLVQLATNKALQWIEVRDCDSIMCFCVKPSEPCATGSVEVVVETQVREG